MEINMSQQNSFRIFLDSRIKTSKNNTINNSNHIKELIGDEYFELLCTYHGMSLNKREYLKETIENLKKHNM